jgi:hypothetical protein
MFHFNKQIQFYFLFLFFSSSFILIFLQELFRSELLIFSEDDFVDLFVCNELQSIFSCLFFLYTGDIFKSNRPNRYIHESLDLALCNCPGEIYG